MGSRTALQYRKQLQSLLPKGRVWNTDEDSVLTKLLYGLSEELARIDDRTLNLIVEKIIETTSELLEDHEEDFGIPEEGEDLEPTTEGRRREVQSKLLEVGQQDKEYFEDIAEALGYDIDIEEFIPAWAGVMEAGDPCGDQVNIFFWKIHIDLDSVEESIEVNIDKLISKINRLKPAHTHTLFDFYNAGFDRGFSIGFDRIPHYDNYWLNPSFTPGFDAGFENNTDYFGTNYTGGFDYGFTIAFDRNTGGGFEPDSFSKTGFKHPA